LPESRSDARIPTGFNHSAQGCEARAALGERPTNPATLKGLNQITNRYNPFRVEKYIATLTRRSRCASTPGCMIKSLWDFRHRVTANFRRLCKLFSTAKYAKYAKTELNNIRSRISRGSRFTIFILKNLCFIRVQSVAKMTL
jgi:hypothetical protein